MMADTDNATTAAGPSAMVYFVFAEIPNWVTVVYLVLICMTIGLGIPGNLITVLAYFFHKEKTNCDWYILFVALMDLLSCAFRGTSYLLEYLKLWQDVAGSEFCKFMYWISQTTVCASIFIIGIVAVDRYSTLCDVKCLKFSVRMSRNICVVLSMMTLVMASPSLFLADNISRGVCAIKTKYVNNEWVIAYYSLIFTLFLIMMVAVVFCYVGIIQKVRSSRRVFVTGEYETNSSVNTNATRRFKPDHSLSQNASSSEVQSDSGYPRMLSISYKVSTSSALLSVPGPSRPRCQAHPNGANIFTSYPNGAQISTSYSKGAQMNTTYSKGAQMNTPYSNGAQMNMPYPNDAQMNTPYPNGGKNNASRKNGILTTEAVLVRSPVNLSEKSKTQRKNFRFEDTSTATTTRLFVSPTTTGTQHARRLRRDFKITGLLFLVTFVFILSWIPPYIAMVKGMYIGYSSHVGLAETILLVYGPHIYIINNFSNPIIYVALSSVYREKVRMLFRKLRRLFTRVRGYACKGHQPLE